MILLGSSPIPSPSRVLILQLRRIGDVLLCTPAIRAIARAFPNSKIDFAVEPPCDEGLWGNPHIDRLLLAPRGSSIRQWIRYAREIRERRYRLGGKLPPTGKIALDL